MSRFSASCESSCADLPIGCNTHSDSNSSRSLRGSRQKKRVCIYGLLFPSVTIVMSIMASRIAFANAFLSRIPKSSSTLRAGRSGTAPTLSYLQRNSRLNNNNNKYGIGISDEDIAEFASSTDFGGYDRPGVQWYPGHIAKAERQLSETLKAVDVVVEVRDARACKATAHPRVGEWCAGSPRIVVLTHLDMVPKAAAATWRKAYDTLGAERWDEAPINRQVANQAKQARDIRSRFDNDGNAKKKNKWKNSSSDAKIEIQNTNITPVEQVLFVNAKQGQGIHALHRAIFKAGAHVQERRERRGLNPRPLRVGIIGYPNVGKSALINKILGRKRAKTANTPGVTRSLQWIRVRTEDSKKAYASGKSSASPTSSTHSNAMKREFELLDSPGIIPAKMVDQSDALLLAACNCIGQAAYDNQAVAAYLCEWLKAVHIMEKQFLTAPDWQKKFHERYGFDPMQKVQRGEDDIVQEEYLTGEDMLFKVADNRCRGDAEDASRKILQDFRTGRMGPISLQLAPQTEEDEGQVSVPIGDSTVLGKQSMRGDGGGFDAEFEKRALEERAQIALQTAKERGLELPPIVDGGAEESEDAAEDVGKGMFDGW